MSIPFTNIAKLRLHTQHIIQADFTNVADVVHYMGAMQAQDYASALWSIALRTPHLVESDVVNAINNREIVRTWPMRGTLHFVAAADVHWMRALLAPRVITESAGMRKQRDISDTLIIQARSLLVAALSGGKRMTRKDIFVLFESHGITTAEQRGITILNYLAQDGLLCLGPHDDKQPTFVLLDEWISPTPQPNRQEALGMLATRYFISHGPATLKDFAGWGNMTIRDAKLGIDQAGSTIVQQSINVTDYWLGATTPVVEETRSTVLLPGFDEYMLGYKDRSASLDQPYAQRITPGGNGVFMPTIVIDGRVAGTWKKMIKKGRIIITLLPFETLPQSSMPLLVAAAERYGRFIGLPAELAPTRF
jgi:winged helix DNA-binding protein